MKVITTLLTLFVLLAARTGMSQGAEIPHDVVIHFKNLYPNAQKIDWDKEKDGSYEIEFKIANVKWEAYYDQQGNWIKTERDVKRAEVPPAVWAAISKSPYANWKVSDMEEHQTPNYTSVFEVKMKGQGRKVYLYFLPNGKQAP